jgi:hypothetical protein
MNIEKMPISQGKSKNIPENKEVSRQSLEMEERMRLFTDEAMREIRKIVRMPGKGIDEQGMTDTAQLIEKELEKSKISDWDNVFAQINQGVKKEIERLNLTNSGQEAQEKITRTKEAWRYIAKHVLGREYMLEKSEDV